MDTQIACQPAGNWARGATAPGLGALLAVTLLIGGCGGEVAAVPTPPPPRVALITILAVPDLNPNAQGRPSPVLLHIYQLRSDSKFLGAEFAAMTEGLDETLSGDLLGYAERMVPPGSKTTLELKLEPETRMLGAIAEYSELPQTDWRTTVVVPESTGRTVDGRIDLRLGLGRSRVALSVESVQEGQ